MSFTIITLRCSTLAPYPRANSCVFPAIWNYGHIKSSLAPRERQKQKNGSWLRGFSIRRKLRFVVCALPGPSADQPPPSGPISSSWKTWILGAMLTFIVPFLSQKWGPFFKLMDKKVESVVEKAEDATEVIEKIAEKVEKIADAIGDELPESGKLRGVADFIEEAAEEAQKDAQLVEDILEKIEEIDKEVEEFMETKTKTPKDTNDQD